MADGPIKIRLKLRGRMDEDEARRLSAEINGLVAYWNTVLLRAEGDLLRELRFFATDGKVTTGG